MQRRFPWARGKKCRLSAEISDHGTGESRGHGIPSSFTEVSGRREISAIPRITWTRLSSEDMNSTHKVCV